MFKIFPFSLVLTAMVFVSPVLAQDPSPKELDAYLSRPDDSFSWKIVDKSLSEKRNTYVVKMVSQTWHDIKWEHSMYLVEPSKITDPNSCILYIGGGSIGKNPGTSDRMTAEILAELSGSCVAMLLQVPNQPLFGEYKEDALIGETLLKAIETKDASWPLLFPMAKSAVRGMDAAQQIFKQERNREIQKFVVTGASKRGWTTWLTAASKDSRVIAIAPVVIDTLNIRKQMDYQLETWGTFSDSIRDYTERNLVQDNKSPVSDFKKSLWEMLDPYSYRSRLTLPKLLIHGTNDPYWTLDATRNYWEGLSGVKYILTLPNAGHGLEGQQLKALQTISVFSKLANRPEADWPKMNWTQSESDARYSVKIDTDIPFQSAKLWTATSETKDFRKSKWSSVNLKNESGAIVAEIPKPKSGHVAYYVELESRAFDIPCSVTTQVWRN